MPRDVTITIGAKNTAGKVLSSVGTQLQSLSNKVDRFGKSFQNVGRSITSVGKKFALFGAAAGAGLAVATRTFASFDDAMFAVAAKSGAVGDSFDQLREKAKQLGSTTKFTATEAAQGMEFLAQAGFKTEEILSAIGPALSLAAAGGVELMTAADIASNVAGGFGLGADEFKRVADVMARASAAANTDIEMMGETFRNVAPIAKAAGQSIEEMAAMLGLLGNAGIQAGQAGTHLKILTQSMVKNQKAIEALGVDVVDKTTGKFLAFGDVMRDLGEATKEMSDTKRVQTFSKIFGRGVASSIVLADAGTAAMDGLREKIADTTVTADTMAETMMKGLGGAFTVLTSAIDGVYIALVETFEVELKKVLKEIANAFSATTDWINENKQLTLGLLAGAGAVGTFGVALIGIGTTLTIAGFAISGLATVMGMVAAAAGLIATPAGVAAVAVGILGGAFLKALHGAGAFDEFLKRIVPGLLKLQDIALETFGGISLALEGKDWALAAEIGWAGVNLAFWEGLAQIGLSVHTTLLKLTGSFTDFFVGVIQQTVTATKAITRALADPGYAAALALATPAEMVGMFQQSAVDFGQAVGGVGDWMEQQRQQADRELQQLVSQAKLNSVVREFDAIEKARTGGPAQKSDVPEKQLTALDKINAMLATLPEGIADQLETTQIEVIE